MHQLGQEVRKVTNFYAGEGLLPGPWVKTLNLFCDIFDRKVNLFIYLLQKMPPPLSVSYSTLLLILKNCPAEIFLPVKSPHSTLKKFSQIIKNGLRTSLPLTRGVKDILKSSFKYLNHRIYLYTSSLKKETRLIVHYRGYAVGS